MADGDVITLGTAKFQEVNMIPHNVLLRYDSVVVGDIRFSRKLASNLYLECTTAGTTAATEPTITGKVAGNTITDGTAVWTVRKFGIAKASEIKMTGYQIASSPSSITSSDNVMTAIGKLEKKANSPTTFGHVELSETSIMLNPNVLSKTVSVTRLGTGAISAVSNDTEVATVSVGNNNTITVTAQRYGAAIITVTVAADSNFTADSTMLSVKVAASSDILSENTPAQIKAAIQDGDAPNLWSVGDRIPIVLNGTVANDVTGPNASDFPYKMRQLTFNNETVYAFIVGFNHNKSVETNNLNSIHFRLGQSSLGDTVVFGSSSWNDSWPSSYDDIDSKYYSASVHRTFINGFRNVLPTAWKNVLYAPVKYAGRANDRQWIESERIQDYIFPPTPLELGLPNDGYGDTNAQFDAHDSTYAYYANGNTRRCYSYPESESNRVEATHYLRANTRDTFTSLAGVKYSTSNDATLNCSTLDDRRGCALVAAAPFFVIAG